MYCITIPEYIRDRPTREADGHPNVKMAVQSCQSTRSGPHGPNRASLLMNPMYSIARTRQCPRKSCSPRQPMAAYMWNGLQPVTSFTLVPNPNPHPHPNPILGTLLLSFHVAVALGRGSLAFFMFTPTGAHQKLQLLCTKILSVASIVALAVFIPIYVAGAKEYECGDADPAS